ncbi:MAG: signal peptidase I [Myxococcales bacterium]|nr:signal peptidase I [Myxococcales bacterium]MCB9642551.1 signal peptidase I [Myxococcales bacterium]
MEPNKHPTTGLSVPRYKGFLLEALRIAAFFLVALAVRSSFAATYYVPSGSMEPSVYTGDRLFAFQHSYGWKLPFTEVHITPQKAPSHGDIVVFVDPRDPQTMLLKRVVAVGGDRLEIRGGQLIRNGKPLPQAQAIQKGPYLYRLETNGAHQYIVQFDSRQSFLRDMVPRTIPKGHFFAMGDNRDHSGDSRIFGAVPYKQLQAKAVRVLWSRNPKAWSFRWNRSGTKLP